MASTSETGHIINIENFRKIIDRCEQFPNYSPPNDNITVVNMTAKWTSANDAHSAYLTARNNTKVPVDDREVLFENMEGIVRRVLYNYECTDASKQAKEDAAGYVRKITGSNVRIPRLENNIPDPKYVSNSQQSFVKKVEHFEQLIIMLKSDTYYKPNENYLKTTALDTMLTDLKNANKSVEQLAAVVDKYRADRNHALYDGGTGIIDVSLACKKYVRSLFGAKSDEAKSVTGIPLKRIMKRNAVIE
jgi:hypothetical protein